MEHRSLARFCFWVLFYAGTLLASLAVMGVLSLMISLPTWRLVAIGLWLLVCFSSLCFPDDIWDRWLPDEKKR